MDDIERNRIQRRDKKSQWRRYGMRVVGKSVQLLADLRAKKAVDKRK